MRNNPCEDGAGSERLVKQINGLSNVKNDGLKPLHARAEELIAKIGRVEVQYIVRDNEQGSGCARQ